LTPPPVDRVVAPELSLAEKRLLLALPKDGSACPAAAVPGFASEGEALLAAGALERVGLVALEESSRVVHGLSVEGRRVQPLGLPEQRIFHAVKGRSLPLAQAVAQANLSPDEARIIVGLAKRSGVVDVVKRDHGLVLQGAASLPPAFVKLANVFAQVPEKAAELGALAQEPDLKSMLDRGLVQATTKTERSLRLTPAGVTHAAALKPDDAAGSEVNQLTPELLARWPTLSPQEKAKHHLRPFAFDVDVAVPAAGKPHPMTGIIQEIRAIFVSLGFQEVAGDYVEPAFWNMDALFIPQDHPAREMQDTFYVKEPATRPVPDALWEQVKGVQTTGGTTGSTGWGGSFRREESERALLRTHTTVTTIRHLAAKPGAPQRIFGIGRVFRNEAMDATHLPEFHQVEGIVLEEGATLSMLMGILGEFYRRMGFPEVQFRPSYYPYTEPSLDVAVKWNGRWLELGGAGIFRPEVTAPLGVKTPVLAWGLGLERLAMLRLGLTDIRQLYLSDVQWLRESPLR
jgi:phenylalanyl-tRNA synthetase alpha chain